MLRVLISDDHEIVLAGLEQIITSLGAEVIGKAVNGFELLNKVKDLEPDLIIVDYKMPGFGLSQLKELVQRFPNKVLVITAINDRAIIRQIIDTGVAGLISKESALDDVSFCLKSVMNGKKFISPDFLEIFFSSPSNNGGLDKLSKREVEVLRLIAEGYSNRQIARMLSLSTRTVDSHRSNILKKLKFRNNQELVKFALKNRLIELN